jgi:hypothetical protein
MRKLLALVVVLFLIGSAGWAQNTTAGNSSPVFDNTIDFDAGALGVGLLSGIIDLQASYERRITDAIAIPAFLFYAGGNSFSGLMIGSGIVFYPDGTALHGWYVRGDLSVGTGEELGYSAVLLGVDILGGYKWTFPSGFVLRLGGGFAYITYLGAGLKLTVALGFAF